MYFAVDRRAFVERAAERVDGTAEQGGSDRHAHHFAGAAHQMAGLDGVDVVEQHAAERIAVEGEGEAGLPALEAQKFIGAHVA